VIKKDEVKLKIENERLVNHLTKQGFDRIKSACALAITNNNLDLALEILTKYTNK
jgi:predicted SPOUT superfamily RNA methylase MTH1